MNLPKQVAPVQRLSSTSLVMPNHQGVETSGGLGDILRLKMIVASSANNNFGDTSRLA